MLIVWKTPSLNILSGSDFSSSFHSGPDFWESAYIRFKFSSTRSARCFATGNFFEWGSATWSVVPPFLMRTLVDTSRTLHQCLLTFTIRSFCCELSSLQLKESRNLRAAILTLTVQRNFVNCVSRLNYRFITPAWGLYYKIRHLGLCLQFPCSLECVLAYWKSCSLIYIERTFWGGFGDTSSHIELRRAEKAVVWCQNYYYAIGEPYHHWRLGF